MRLILLLLLVAVATYGSPGRKRNRIPQDTISTEESSDSGFDYDSDSISDPDDYSSSESDSDASSYSDEYSDTDEDSDDDLRKTSESESETWESDSENKDTRKAKKLRSPRKSRDGDEWDHPINSGASSSDEDQTGSFSEDSDYSSDDSDSGSWSDSESESLSDSDSGSWSDSESESLSDSDSGSWSDSDSGLSSDTEESSIESSEGSDFSEDSAYSESRSSPKSSKHTQKTKKGNAGGGERSKPAKKRLEKRGKPKRKSIEKLHDADECIQVCGLTDDGDHEPCECHMNEIDCNSEDLDDADICLSENFLKKHKNYVVEKIDLSSNEIDELDSDFLIPEHTRTIIKVDLNDNVIDKIEDNTFKDFSKLEYLNLAKNELNALNHKMFIGLKNLKTLDLRNNDIEDLDGSPFRHLEKLERLYLAGNPIKSLDKGAFAGLKNLRILDLDNLDLNMAHEEWFIDLSKLRTLTMKNNHFRVLPSLHKLTGLTKLDLSGNPIYELPGHSFKGLTSLKELDLDNMPVLWFIHECAFCGLDMLEELDMSNNQKLRAIHKRAFGDHPEDFYIDTIILKNNNLSTLHEDMLDWDIMETIDLSGNPWYCDCEIQWINELPSDILYDRIFCNKPDSLAQTPLDEMEPEDFECTYPMEGARRWAPAGTGRNAMLIITAVIISAVLLVGFLYFLVGRRGRPSKDGSPKYAYRNLGRNMDDEDVVIVNADSLRGRKRPEDFTLPEPVNL